MKRVNNMRANFLFNRFKTTQFEINVVSMLKELYVDEPSLSETINCKHCDFLNKSFFPVVSINNDAFNNNISNIESAIVDNFPQNIACTNCQKAVDPSREYGNHIFVEISSGSYTTNTTDYEPRLNHKFADIPISIFNNQYVLLAAFLYRYGVYDNDIGHYTVAIKLNERWELFDDHESKTKELSNQHSAIIHALLYVKYEEENEKENEDKNSDNSLKKRTRTKKRRIKLPLNRQTKKQKQTE